MDKDLKKLYNYCKSQGYSKSRKEFEKELEDLALEQLGSEELSSVAGGKKAATAFAASLVSALSIASPFASAHSNSFTSKKSVGQTLSRDIIDSYRDRIEQEANKSTFSKYKDKITSSVKQGIDYAKKNEKTIKDILLKKFLPVGGTLGFLGIAGTVGLIARNMTGSNKTDDKMCRIYGNLLGKSYKLLAEKLTDLSDQKQQAIFTEFDKKNFTIPDTQTKNVQAAYEICDIIFEALNKQVPPKTDLHQKIKKFAKNSEVYISENGEIYKNRDEQCTQQSLYDLLTEEDNNIAPKISLDDFLDKSVKIIPPSVLHSAFLSGGGNESSWNELIEETELINKGANALVDWAQQKIKQSRPNTTYETPEFPASSQNSDITKPYPRSHRVTGLPVDSSSSDYESSSPSPSCNPEQSNPPQPTWPQYNTFPPAFAPQQPIPSQSSTAFTSPTDHPFQAVPPQQPQPSAPYMMPPQQPPIVSDSQQSQPSQFAQPTHQLTPDQKIYLAATLKSMFEGCEKLLHYAFDNFVNNYNLLCQIHQYPQEQKISLIEQFRSSFKSQIDNQIIYLKHNEPNMAALSKIAQKMQKCKDKLNSIQNIGKFWNVSCRLYELDTEIAEKFCLSKLNTIPNYGQFYDQLIQYIRYERIAVVNQLPRDYSSLQQVLILYYNQRYKSFQRLCENLGIQAPYILTPTWLCPAPSPKFPTKLPSKFA